MTRREWLEVATGAGILAVAAMLSPTLARTESGVTPPQPPATPGTPDATPTCEIPEKRREPRRDPFKTPETTPTPDVITPDGKKLYRHGCGGLSETPPQGPPPACGMARMMPPTSTGGRFTDQLAARHAQSR